ncbi:MAG: glycosyltransferase [Bacteroidia bacterium]
MKSNLPEILFITSYPPRECGIATYSEDLIKALDNKFGNSFALKVCALEAGNTSHTYPDEVKYILDTSDAGMYVELSHAINADTNIRFVVIQHEFGFFSNGSESAFSQFLYELTKSVIIVFHTVLPHPDEALRIKVRYIAEVCKSIVVMTKNSKQILIDDYGVAEEKIVVIPHGTHLVPHPEKEFLKIKYNLTGRTILSTFGLLSSGKNIETTLTALPEIIKVHPDTLFLVIGKTHPGVVKSEGEKYREMLQAKVEELKLQQHVKFINRYLPLPEILEYLQLTDIYLFTSKDPNQAVSGTFSYAISCGCPVISTPIPHAREVLDNDAGIIIDFESPKQLSDAVVRLLSDEPLRKNISSNGLHRIAPTAWENSAIAHAKLFTKTEQENFSLHYRLPEISLEHVKKMTTDFGMIQFSKLNQPDIDSGYTLDDNARALIALCMHFELTGDEEDIRYISTYLEFIKHCLKDEGYFLNYVDADKKFTEQNEATNLADSNGRAIWALGYLISKSELLPSELVVSAEETMQKVLLRTEMMHSTRAMAFAIKGLYYSNLEKKSTDNSGLIKRLANRLVQMYRHESEHNWEWFESYLTYANSILPEALLCAWLETGETIYKETAKVSFDFLLSLTFNEIGIKVISNKSWMHKGQQVEHHGEQPIDVAYTILALSRFYNVFNEPDYLQKMQTAFNWFLGNNHLHRIIYNPCTGGCYDGLEENHVNLNQGAESTLSYLMARLTIEKHFNNPSSVAHEHESSLVFNV